MLNSSFKKKRILFITPFASRTGSEIMIWYILKYIDRTKFEVALVSYRNGELLADIPDDIKVFLVPGQFNTFDRLKFHLGIHPIDSTLKSIQKEFKADLWYLNTIALERAVDVAIEIGVPYVVHFHEMPLSYSFMKAPDFRRMIDNAHLLIGCSEATCEGIKQAGGKKVELVHSFINSDLRNVDQDRVVALKKELGIKEGDYVWLMSGTTSERKGFDFLPDIAEQIDDDRVHLLWVGAPLTDGYVDWVEHRIKYPTWKTKVHLLGKQKEDYAAYFHCADAFMLTSRQDPFPLVMIEAASIQKPIVAFPSGGASEFVVEGAGLVTEDISVRQMVVGMKKVMKGEANYDPEISLRQANQFTTKNGILEIQEVLNKL